MPIRTSIESIKRLRMASPRNQRVMLCSRFVIVNGLLVLQTNKGGWYCRNFADFNTRFYSVDESFRIADLLRSLVLLHIISEEDCDKCFTEERLRQTSLQKRSELQELQSLSKKYGFKLVKRKRSSK